MVEQLSDLPDDTVGFTLSGKLHDEDYKAFVPLVDEAIAEHGKVRLLVVLHDFEGWDAHALRDDTRFAATHCTTIERVAIVGETLWERWMAEICRPFTKARVEYFDKGEVEAAKAWLSGE